MLKLLLLLAVVYSEHTLHFDERPAEEQVTHYLVYWKTLVSNPYWVNPPERCDGSPCTILLRDPAPGNVVYFSVVAVNAAGESPH